MPVFLMGILLAIHAGIAVPPVHASELTITDLKVIAASYATAYNLNTDLFLKTIECESKWNPSAEGDFVNGTPTSFGLAQLHNVQRDWGLTKEKAKDPTVALEVMAKAWSRGEMRRWTCYPI